MVTQGKIRFYSDYGMAAHENHHSRRTILPSDKKLEKGEKR
jgi:hypothetical protein